MPATPADDRARAFETALREAVRGDVRFDAVTRGIHATDASHYQVMPVCVVWPVDADDAVAAIRTAGEYDVAITPRGGGTSLSGQTMWHSMILDFSRYMDAVLEVDMEQRWARVQPGVIRDRLNAQLAAENLHFAPDPATGNRATVGGMVGNNASGTRSIVYGRTSDHVIELTVALIDGTVLTLAPRDRETWQAVAEGTGREAEIYAGVTRIIDTNRDEIAARYPKVMRRVNGYALDAFVGEDLWNLAKLIVGSEGTLATVLEAKVRLTPLPAATALCAVHFRSLTDALRGVGPILEHAPSAVELLDEVVINEAVRNRSTARLADFIEGKPSAMLLVELFGDDAADADRRVHQLADDLAERDVGYSRPIRSDREGQNRIWAVRKLGLGLISNVKGPRKGQAFVEDACVPVEVLPEYIEQVLGICREHDVQVTVYAHASVGVLHVRPILDLHLREDVAKMKSIAEAVFPLVQKYGGAWSGEHGDGLVRGGFLERFFGSQIYTAFREVKALFDPKGLMNPGKIVDVPPMTENLRYGGNYRLSEVPAAFHYRDQGGFALAVEQCNGVGACRKISAGTMCPSYMATRDEAHSTRGRANALRLAMTGQLGDDALAGDGVHETLELCLACKACRSECPNAVDMARLKSDALQIRFDRHGTPLKAKATANLPRVAARVAGPLAPLVNAVQRSGPARWAAARFAGFDSRRSLPPFARQSLGGWFAGRKATGGSGDRGEVVLFDDTFASYFEPRIGRAAVELLEACGYRVRLAQAGCCQRTAISSGLLRQARRDGEKTLRNLDEHARAERPILTLEPSCHSALVEDLPDLVEDAALGGRVARRVVPLEAFLAEQIREGKLRGRFRSAARRAVLHGHCHQKAGPGTGPLRQVLGEVEDLAVEEIDAGCCGMAGSFGYQHYDLSMKIGEDRLFPAVRHRPADAAVIAPGTSCRHQLHDACDVEAKHWVELLRYEEGAG